MPQYHPDRRKICDTFEIPLNSKKEKLECTVFEVWRDADEGIVVRCGQSQAIEISLTTGISDKLSSSVEGTLSASIGPKYLTTISASVKAALGREINWSQSKTIKRAFTIAAPECGFYSMTTYQLCREYELSYFQRGGWLFSDKHWDRKWGPEVIVERTLSTDSIHDKGHDESCHCPPKPPLECDGRLSLDFGTFSMRVPYKVMADGSFSIVLSGKMVEFTFSDKQAAARGLHDGIVITVPAAEIPEPLLFLGRVPESTETLEATIYMYKDRPRTAEIEIEVLRLEGSVAKENIVEAAVKKEDDTAEPEEFLQH